MAPIQREYDAEFLRLQAIPLRQIVTDDAIFVIRMSDDDMRAWNEGRYDDASGDVWISWIPMGQSGSVHAAVECCRQKFPDIWARLEGRLAESHNLGFAMIPPVIDLRREAVAT